MSQQYLGEIRQVAFNFAPRGWALCNGQLMPIQQNQALFSLLGVQFGGNGVQTFGLPDLRGRTTVSYSSSISMGQIVGTESVTMLQTNLPMHTHPVQASITAATATDPTGQIWAPVIDGAGSPNMGFTENVANTTMDPAALSPAGGSQPIPIMQPYLVTNYIIALSGIFPSRG
jgi:microcystin-dependent protein